MGHVQAMVRVVGLRMQVPGLMAVLSIPVCIIFQTPPWRFIKMGGMLCLSPWISRRIALRSGWSTGWPVHSRGL